MQFNNYLDKILSQPTRVKLLRFLATHKPEMTGRELARFCDISHMQVHRALGEFVAQGIVLKRRVGKAYIYTFNEKNILVHAVLIPLFLKERNLLRELLNSLLKNKMNEVLSVVIFGSVAKGEERPDSDVDVFILSKKNSNDIPFKEFLSEIEVKFHQETGNRLSPIVLSINELNDKFKSNKTLVSNMLSGEVVAGKAPREFLHGWQKAT